MIQVLAACILSRNQVQKYKHHLHLSYHGIYFAQPRPNQLQPEIQDQQRRKNSINDKHDSTYNSYVKDHL